jgi:hypothetical protein
MLFRSGADDAAIPELSSELKRLEGGPAFGNKQ